MASMKGPTNQFYSPNTNHQVQYPGSSNMIYFFNQHVKKTGPAMQQVAAGKSKRLKDGRVEVSFAIRQGSQAKDTKVYYSDAATLWTERTWMPVEARRKGKLFRAYIPAEAARKPFDWYAVATDVNPAAWGPDNLHLLLWNGQEIIS